METMTIDDVELKEKRVLVRVDFNVPMTEHGTIADDKRIVESLPTIRKILDSGGIAILMSHLGRPKGGPSAEFSLKPVAKHLGTLLSSTVHFAHDCVGEGTRKLVASLKPGDVLLLENLRFHAEEEKNDPAFAKELASYGDVYVNDAFGTAHRAHASTEGITKFIKPCVAGYLMKKEIEYLTQAVGNPKRPYVAIVGGAKISGKIDVIQNLLPKVDVLVIGGGMAFTFFRAQDVEVGDSLVEVEKIPLAKKLLEEIKASRRRVILPVDCVIADKFDNNAQRRVVPVTKIPVGWRALDIGPETAQLIRLETKNAKTIVWNGPMGVFEMSNFANGTLEVAKILAEATRNGATTIVGGGDSAAAVAQMGFEAQISHVSTGGGASLEFLEGKQLPGLAALDKK
ncbi:MAG: phosphoglycerate kinase [Ignavibacteria bacterium]